MSLCKLQKTIGYTFVNEGFLKQALTHSSCSIVEDGQPFNNERLEFLGDRVLNCCVSDILYRKFTDENEGCLSKRHASLVQQATLAGVAKNIGLGEFLSLGKGEDSSSGREKPSILSDAVEALIAAIYLDSNMENAQNFVNKFLPEEANADLVRDPKSRLQEWLQARKQPLPSYNMLKTTGKAHQRIFQVEVATPKNGSAVGEGETKRQAQQNAAKELLIKLEN
jgi:ribonuclease-3